MKIKIFSCKLIATVFIFLFFGLLHRSFLCAAAPSKTEVLHQIRQSAASPNLRISYRQITTSDLTQESQQSSGVVSIKDKKLFRWDQLEPEKQTIIIRGSQVLIYTPRFQQVIEKKWEQWRKDNLWLPGLLNSEESFRMLEENYDWKIQQSSAVLRLDLSAKELENSATITLWLNLHDYRVQKSMWKSGGISVTITFDRYEEYPVLDGALFQLKKSKDLIWIEAP